MDVGVPGGERWNVQSGGDMVSTISLLGCSTSVALATGLTDKEEEKEEEEEEEEEKGGGRGGGGGGLL